MKTTGQIKSDIWVIVNAYLPIADLNGGIYKDRRPTDSTLNDCIITLIPGQSGKFLSDGAIYIKIYYNDLNVNNTYYEDSTLGSQLEQMLIDLSEILLSTNSYSFEVQSREHYTDAIEDIHQHYAILKMNFKLTQN